VKILFDGDVDVHYGFIYLLPVGEDMPDLSDSRRGQANGLCGAAVPGSLSVVTGTHTGPVPVRAELHDAEPPVGEQWEDVVEVSLDVRPEEYWLSAFAWAEPVDGLPAGTHRARWCATGMDEAHDRTRLDGEPEIDRYLLQLWPALPAPDAVVRRGSENAGYWHGVAAATDPPPPPATPRRVG
jgi:hypothetical protein